nr:phosphotransferase [Nocardia wallacei]
MVRVGDRVVRVGPSWRGVDDLRWSGRVAVAAAVEVPEVVAPISTVDGAGVVCAAGRPITVWPFVAGTHGDDRDADQRRQAAQLLARVHRALERTTFEAPPHRTVPEVAVPDLADAELDAWLDDFRAGHRRRHAVHGDFYAANILVRSGTLVGLVDWDEATLAPPEWELAGAAWEWGDGLTTLDLTAARRFIEDYLRVGGTVTAMDETTLRQLIRSRIRSEVAYDRATTGPDGLSAEDRAYQRRQLQAFRALRPNPARNIP